MKKKIVKKLFIFLIIALILFSIYNFTKFFTTGKQEIGIVTASKFYTNSKIEAIVSVDDAKTNLSKKSKVTIELLDKDGKKVKDVKQKQKIEKGENANFSIDLPDNIETGSYQLKITATSGIFKDTSVVNVAIVNEVDSNIIISLDKGIYKPGDEVNFRALVTSKKDNTPIEKDISISIYDGNDNRVYLEETKTSEFGIISGKFVLAEEVNSGEYKLKVVTNNVEKTKIFTVNPYITPRFEASINTDKENYLIGETAKVTFNAKYFFGENVKNAKVEAQIGDAEISGLTNENGEFSTDYKIEKAGSLKLKASIIDSSNYLVEAEKTIYGSTDIFEIEILPEYNSIIKGIDNDIYVITNKIDGTPVKTYMTVNIGDINKQVITEENGVGKFTLTSQEVQRIENIKHNNSEEAEIYNYNRNSSYEMIREAIMEITAEDMEKNVVSISCPIGVDDSKKIAIKTDKIKYNQGDDINLKLNSTSDILEEKIFIYKNNELLKMISTDQDEVIFDLGEEYGLIDIFVPVKDRYNNYNYYDTLPISRESYTGDYSKKTIFITPNKKLNINIETDSEVYKPGDTLNISFQTIDEENNSVDAALMVSILDEAILNLAENDLSIDNIKLALENIEFANGITAADVYSCLINEASEQKLMTLLLRQNTKNPNVINNTNINNNRYENLNKAIFSGAIVLVTIILIACLKSKRFTNVLIDVINVIAIFIITSICLHDLLYYEFDFSELMSYLICAVIATVAYILVLYKQKSNLFKIITDLVIIPLPAICLLYGLGEWLEEYVVLLLLLPPVLLSIVTVICRRKTNVKEIWTNTKNILTRITKIELLYILAYLIIEILGIYSIIGRVITFVIFYAICEIIYKKNHKSKIEKGRIDIHLTGMEILGIIAGIILIIMIFGAILNPINSGDIMYSADSMPTTDATIGITNSGSSSSSRLEDVIDSIETFTNEGASTQRPDIGTLNSAMSNISKQESKVEQNETIEVNEEKQEITEENIRNVFLESLAFIPELITNSGKAETDIKISDNITTWNIQVVGNTKDGNVGFNTSSIKVFKEFFIDFTLPTNSVVTDKTSIPITAYNYTNSELNISINVKENDWCKIGEYAKEITVDPGQTKLIYIPIEILKDGNNTLRIEAKSGKIQDIVEKTMKITPNGIEKAKVIGSGTIEKNYSQDFFTTEEAIENSRNLKIKIYPSLMSQVVEGMENIFRMPTGCFEQTSSSLYPNVLALRYLEETGKDNEQIRAKALDYISKGYQRLLSFEVAGESGGYSLYGDNPAEPVITAFGLMELSDLSEVYEVEEKVIENMKEYLFKQQKVNGSFNYNSTYIGGASSTNDLAMNAYIIWALSETCPKDERLDKSIEYLESKLDKIKDNYTRALVANIFINTNNKLADELIADLLEQLNNTEKSIYISSNSVDYYGTSGIYQNIQTTALTSLALSKKHSNTKTNINLINYIIENKDRYGTWGTTQSTILALKAINEFNTKSDLSNQTISIKVNDEAKELKLKDNVLDIYEFNFDNISKENKISIEMKKGKVYYEIIEAYYVPYEKAEIEEKIKVSQTMNSSVKINDVITQNITVENISSNTIRNGLVQINIPQGCSALEESLSKLVYNGIIEKYEYSYGKINLYLRNFENKQKIDFSVEYRAQYPEKITGGAIRVYDYYNPNIEGLALPVNITVTE